MLIAFSSGKLLLERQNGTLKGFPSERVKGHSTGTCVTDGGGSVIQQWKEVERDSGGTIQVTTAVCIFYVLRFDNMHQKETKFSEFLLLA